MKVLALLFVALHLTITLQTAKIKEQPFERFSEVNETNQDVSPIQIDDGFFDPIYQYDILEDYRRVDYEVGQEWMELFNIVLAGYGYLKQEAEDELKKAVKWVEDYCGEIQKKYEQALYDFEQIYISFGDSDEKDYKFLYDIEQIVYDDFDLFDDQCGTSQENMEAFY